MIEDQIVTHAGIRYLWSFRPPTKSPTRAWDWSFAGRVESAPAKLVCELNRVFIDSVAVDMVAELQKNEYRNDYEWFLYVLRDMGATEDQIATLVRLGSDSSRMPTHRIQYSPPDQSPWNHLALRDWLSSSERLRRALPWAVTIIGAGPFEESVIGERSKGAGIELLGTNEATEVVVLGQRDWAADNLEGLIERRVGEDLRIYSQEMFLTLGMYGSDPFDGPRSLLEAFSMGHPGLRFVSRRWQGWETSYVDEDWRHHSHRRLAEENWIAEGPMHVLGYCVGKTGQPTEARHRILKRAYTGRLPIVGPVKYMADWGVEGSSRRLRKIADSIATFCCNLKQKRTHTSDDAIRDWEADLDWLKAEFYHELRCIGWPSTYI